MHETVSNNSSIECQSVSSERIWQVLRWIHFDLTEKDFAALLADVGPGLETSPEWTPLEIVDGEARIAAAYFVRLSGSVATLGGIRAESGFETQAGLVLQEFQLRLLQAGVAQIQALLDVRNLSNKMVMLNSPFRQATTVKHLWFELQDSNYSTCSTGNLAGFTFEPASRFTRNQINSLVESTLVGTLDCPDLDGLRSPDEVVSGFLESQPWDASLPWWILCDGETLSGCVLVNKHPNRIYELAYLGLIPSARGRGLGRALVQFAIDYCRNNDGNIITTAVDTQNWPALNIYCSNGFTEFRELAVWLPKVAKIRQVVA